MHSVWFLNRCLQWTYLNLKQELIKAALSAREVLTVKVRIFAVAAIDCRDIDLTEHHLVFLFLIPTIDCVTFMYTNGRASVWQAWAISIHTCLSKLLEPGLVNQADKKAWHSLSPDQTVMKSGFVSAVLCGCKQLCFYGEKKKNNFSSAQNCAVPCYAVIWMNNWS